MTTAQDVKVLRAVVVDDTPDIRRLLVIALQRDGDIEVVAEAGDGLAGVTAVEAHQPDVVLLDLAMPVMDGLEALPRIRRACPGARVVVLSGFEAEAMADRALDAGADGYLQKGTSPARILGYVRHLLTGDTDPPPRVRAPEPPRPGPRFLSAAPPGQDEVVLLAAEAAEAAPVALLLLSRPTAEPLVSYANASARALLGGDGRGTPLRELAPELALLVSRNSRGLDEGTPAQDCLVLGGHGQHAVTLTPLGEAGLVVLVAYPTVEGDEAARLRQAISTTAHEIRNPVTVLSGVAHEIRRRGHALAEQQRDLLLAAVARQAATLERLTEDLLTAAQAKRGSLRVEVTEVPLAPLLDEAVGDLPEHVRFDVAEAAGVVVLADRTRLGQMMTNLLTNAVKYGAPPYAVRVARDGGSSRPMVRIEVVDHGPGVPPEFRDQLFEEFTRASVGQRGTGLGLFVVRSLAQAQDGWVEHSESEGGGSTFTLTLPEAR